LQKKEGKGEVEGGKSMPVFMQESMCFCRPSIEKVGGGGLWRVEEKKPLVPSLMTRRKRRRGVYLLQGGGGTMGVGREITLHLPALGKRPAGHVTDVHA